MIFYILTFQEKSLLSPPTLTTSTVMIGQSQSVPIWQVSFHSKCILDPHTQEQLYVWVVVLELTLYNINGF